jgi:hypothetical protein
VAGLLLLQHSLVEVREEPQRDSREVSSTSRC